MSSTQLANRPSAHRKCGVEGCEEKHRAMGWCDKHYKRWLRHGNPEAGRKYPTGRPPKGDLLKFLLKVVENPPETQCVAWIYGNYPNGYGMIRYRGRMVGAHRLALKLYSQSTPLPKIEARHLCGNRACVNPLHLAWGSAKENQADRLLHGTDGRGERHSGVKLTEKQVRAIRLDARPHREIAKDYSIDRANVGAIKLRKSWKHIT